MVLTIPSQLISNIGNIINHNCVKGIVDRLICYGMVRCYWVSFGANVCTTDVSKSSTGKIIVCYHLVMY